MQGKGAHRQELAVPSLNPSSESQAPALSRVAADSWCWASLMAQRVKSPLAMQGTQEMRVRSLGWEDPLEEEMAPTPMFLPEKSHGQRSLAGYSQFKVGPD